MTTEAREVGGYRVLRQIGSGGMGTVHEAVDAEGRHVALKLLHPHFSADLDARRRLEREVSLLHRVRDAGVARVLDAEVAATEAFVVTELVEGLTLEADVTEGGPFSTDELAALADGLSDALEAIHAVGVVHRDLKPGNVMMSGQGPVLIDFGIAQVADDARLTRTGLVTGTPGYLAPEILDGAEPEPTGDWWAWAAVLTFAATGRPPFGRGPLAAVMGRVSTGQVDTTGLPPVLARALRAALHPDPAQRLDREGVLAVLAGSWDDAARTAVLSTGAPDGTADGTDDEAATRALPGDSMPTDRPAPTAVLGPAPPRPADNGAAPRYGAAGQTTHLPGAPGEQPTRAMPRYQETDPPAPPPADPWVGAGAGYGQAHPGQRHPGQPHPPQPTYRGLSHPAQPYPGQPYPGQPEPVPAWAVPPRRRTLLVSAAGLAVSAVAVSHPGAFAVVAAALLLVLGTVGWAGRARRQTRLRRGPRRGDDARMYAGLPWHLLRALLSALPGTVLGALAGAATLWTLDQLLTDPVVAEQGIPSVGRPWILWAAAAATLIVAWLTPTSSAARQGARAIAAVVLPSRTLRAVVTVLLLAVAVVVALLLLTGAAPEPVWAPLPPLGT